VKSIYLNKKINIIINKFFFLECHKRKLSDSRKLFLKKRRNHNKLKQRDKRRTFESRFFVPAMKLPCEVFTTICAYLPPSDLYSLTQVCEKWRNWLIAPSNNKTQFIWSSSRKKFMKHVKNPPANIDEFRWYIRRRKEAPNWVGNCFFCFNAKARKSCRFKGSRVRTCKHCHSFYGRPARKKVCLYSSLSSLILLLIYEVFSLLQIIY